MSWLYVGLRTEIIQNQFIYFFFFKQKLLKDKQYLWFSGSLTVLEHLHYSDRKCSKILSVSPVPLLNHSTRSMLYLSACSLNVKWWEHYYFHHVHLKMNWETLLLCVLSKWKFCHLHFQTCMIYFWNVLQNIIFCV